MAEDDDVNIQPITRADFVPAKVFRSRSMNTRAGACLLCDCFINVRHLIEYIEFAYRMHNTYFWPRNSTQWFTVDNNAMNGSREKKPRKAETEMGVRHNIGLICVWCDGHSKQNG